MKTFMTYLSLLVFSVIGLSFLSLTGISAGHLGIGLLGSLPLVGLATGGESELIASVFDKIINDGGYAFDNIFNRVALIKYMMLKDSKDGEMLGTNNRVRKLDGGSDIEIPLEYAVGDDMQFFKGLEQIGFQLKDTMTNAKYDWRHAAQPLLLDNKDLLQIKGNAAKIADYAGAKIRNMNKSMITSINSALLNLTPGADEFNSIPVLVQYDPTASSTVGGLDQSAKTWWRNKKAASSATTWALLMAELDQLFLDIVGSMSGDSPDLLLTDDKNYKQLIAYARSKGTHTFVNSEIDNVFNLGGKAMMINGATLVWDTGVQEPVSEASHHAAYYLNTDYLQFCVHQDRQFALEGPQKLTITKGQDATAWVVLLMGNLTCSNRSKNGVLYSIAELTS